MHETVNWRKFIWISGGLLTAFMILFLLLNHQIQNARQEENLSQVGTEDYIVNSAMTNYAFMNKNDLRFQFTNPEALYAYTEDELKILMDEMAE